MSLSSALSTSISALKAQSAAISAVSENIANTSTTAYKNTDVTFSSLVAGNTTSSGYSSGGVVYDVTKNTTEQGQIETTSSSTNIAINGNGFFVVSDDVDNLASAYVYSRNGDFSTDADGYLVNTEGYYLMGLRTDADGNVLATNSNDLSSLEAIDVNAISGTAQATSQITMDANLPADADIGDVFNTSTEVFDSLGVSHTIDQTWTKTAANEWTLDMSDPYGSDSSVPTGTLSPSTIAITFNGDGSLASYSPDPPTFTITGFTSGSNDSTITYDIGTIGGTDGLTQYSSNSTDPEIEISLVENDGVRYGSLSSLEIDDTGLVTAVFDNGLRQAVYQIPIATFQNPDGLTHVSGTVYDENENAGNYSLHLSGDGGAGSIVSSAIEASTADTSDEFNKMITAQQAYSSAAQVVSTVKDMFDTLISSVR
jgi:flagellar hook protein FlgE